MALGYVNKQEPLDIGFHRSVLRLLGLVVEQEHLLLREARGHEPVP
jgi:hypothetical protein